MKKVLKKAIVILLAIVMCVSTIYIGTFADSDDIAVIEGLENYVVKKATVTNTAYTHMSVPVNYVIYSAPEVIGTKTQDVIIYVINWNGERIGTESDVDILKDYIAEGYAIAVLDYQNNTAVNDANIGTSVGKMREFFKYSSGFSNTGITDSVANVYILPAGYRLARDIPYFDMAVHSSKGTLNAMIEGWNTDIAQKSNYKQADGSLYPKISSFERMKELLPELRTELRLDIIYPSAPLSETPVVSFAATDVTRMYNLASNENGREEPIHFLFGGYTLSVFDFFYNAYNFPLGHTSTFETIKYNTAKTSRAAIRCIRYYAEQYGYSTEYIGVAGMSKGSPAPGFLASKNNADLPEEATFPEDTTGTLLEGGENVIQPYSTYEGGYQGEGETPISSEVTVAYTAAGSGVYNMWEVWGYTEKRPLLLSCGANDAHGNWSYWFETIDWARNNATEPFLAMSMYDKGHQLPHGIDTVYGYDRARAFFTFFDQFLHPDTYVPSLVYVYPANNKTAVSVNDTISFKFYGTMDYESVVSSVKIINTATGEALEGTWSANELNSLYEFKHGGLTAGTRYEIRFAEGIYNADYDSETDSYVKGTLTLPVQSHSFLTEGNNSVYPIADTYVDEANPANAYGSADTVYIDGAAGAEKIAFVTFKAEHIITASTVKLRFPVKTGGGQDVKIYALDGYTVDEATLTYNNMPSLSEGDLVGEYRLEDGGVTLDLSAVAGKLKGENVTLVIKDNSGELYNHTIDPASISTSSFVVDQYPINRIWSGTGYYRLGGDPKTVALATYEDEQKILITADNGWDRVKFYNTVFDKDLTENDIGKVIKISFSVLTDVDSSVTYGLMSANAGGSGLGATSVFASNFYTDAGSGEVSTVANEWTDVEFTVTVDEIMVNSQIGMLTIQAIGASQDKVTNYYIDYIKAEQLAADSSYASKENTEGYKLTLITENTYYYSDTDFTEPVYVNKSALSGTSTIVDEKIDDNNVQAVKLVRLQKNQNDYRANFKISDNNGTSQFYLDAGKKYQVSYKVKAVSAPGDFWVSIDATKNAGTVQYRGGANYIAIKTGAFSEHTNTSAEWQSVDKVYTASSSGYAMVSVAHNTSDTNSTGETVDIRIADLKIVALPSVSYEIPDDLTIDTSSFAASARADADFSTIVPQVNNVMWYTDEACTKPAVGKVNASAVTLYAKKMWYSNIDFNEYVYSPETWGKAVNGRTWANNSEVILPAENSQGDYAMKLTSLRYYWQVGNGRGILLTDEAGTGLFTMVKDGTKYRVTYGVKKVNAPYNFDTYIYQTDTPVSPSTRKQVGSSGNGSGTNATVYTQGNISVTPNASSTTSGAMLVVNWAQGSGATDRAECDIYFDNITIAAQTSFTYYGISDTSALTATAYANQRYEDVLTALDSPSFVGWYLDKELTVPAQGIINAASVTLYPKFSYAAVTTFDEDYYLGVAAVGSSYATNMGYQYDTDSARGHTMKFTRYYPAGTGKSTYRAVRLLNETATGSLKLAKGTSYKITYDVKAVSAAGAINLSVALTSNANAGIGNYPLANTVSNPISVTGSWVNDQSFIFTAPITGYAAIVITGENNGDCEVYIDNMTVERVNVSAPAEAGLFAYGDTSTNSGITGTTEGSAVYVENGVEYAAFRVFGEYIAPANEAGTAPEYSKVIIDKDGTTANIAKRHVILGYGSKQAEPTVDNNYAISTSEGEALSNCWSYTNNGDGTFTVRFSLLLKNIPKAYANTAFYARAAIVTDAGETLYSGQVRSGISAQALYDLNGDTSLSWFN